MGSSLNYRKIGGGLGTITMSKSPRLLLEELQYGRVCGDIVCCMKQVASLKKVPILPIMKVNGPYEPNHVPSLLSGGEISNGMEWDHVSLKDEPYLLHNIVIISEIEKQNTFARDFHERTHEKKSLSPSSCELFLLKSCKIDNLWHDGDYATTA